MKALSQSLRHSIPVNEDDASSQDQTAHVPAQDQHQIPGLRLERHVRVLSGAGLEELAVIHGPVLMHGERFFDAVLDLRGSGPRRRWLLLLLVGGDHVL